MTYTKPSPFDHATYPYVATPTSSSSGTMTWTPSTTSGFTTSRAYEVCNLVQDGYWVRATGSRVTKSGWTDASDWDYVVYDPDKTLEAKLTDDPKWVVGGSGNGEEFNSFKKGDINFILVDKEEVWKKYIIATNLIKSLDCKTKKERIAIFDSVFGRDKNTKAVEF